jgi:hypothetical protein
MIGSRVTFPNIEGSEYLLQHLDALGWCESTGMGLKALSFTEIRNYIEITETALSALEVLIINKMSRAYVRESNNKSIYAKSPFGDLTIQKGNSFGAALKKLAIPTTKDGI